MGDQPKWTGSRTRPHPRCPDCQRPVYADDGAVLSDGVVCPRHDYSPRDSIAADPDGMGSADEWRPWP